MLIRPAPRSVSTRFDDDLLPQKEDPAPPITRFASGAPSADAPTGVPQERRLQGIVVGATPALRKIVRVSSAARADASSLLPGIWRSPTRRAGLRARALRGWSPQLTSGSSLRMRHPRDARRSSRRSRRSLARSPSRVRRRTRRTRGVVDIIVPTRTRRVDLSPTDGGAK